MARPFVSTPALLQSSRGRWLLAAICLATPLSAYAAEPEEEDGEFTFEVVDLTEDEEALKEELKVEVQEVEGDSGTLKGVVKDAATGAPLIGAYVEALGEEFQTKTNFDGEYELPLPVGIHEIRIRADANKPRQFGNVTIENGGTTEINVELDPLGGEQIVLVEAEMNRESEGARLTQRKEAAAARDLMSRDEIQKGGGGSTASVARRIVGVTLVGGRYLFVRGLGHRYVSTFFDRARVPSPEPELRTVPLDIFPTSALSAINIQKTYTPDVPGDFAGGSIQLESREVPEELTVKLGAKIGGDSSTTFRQGFTNAGFWEDALGFGNIPRALPAAIPKDNVASGVFDPVTYESAYSPEDTERFGEAMYTKTEIGRNTMPPNFQLNASVGYGSKTKRAGTIGVLGSLGYANRWHTRRYEVFKNFSASDGEVNANAPNVDYTGATTTNRINWAALGLLNWDFTDKHRLSSLAFYSREASSESRELIGTARGVGAGQEILSTRARYIMRSILFTRLGGRHIFESAHKARIDWFASYSQARRDDPSMRDMYFQRNNDGDFRYGAGEGAGVQYFFDLTDHTESGALDVSLPFTQWKGLSGQFKSGVWVEGKQREFTVRRFSYGLYGTPVPVGTGNVINDDTIGGGVNGDGGVLRLVEGDDPQNNYRASQEIYAGYGMLDLPFVRWFKLSAGVRFEASNIESVPFDQFDRNDPTIEEDLQQYRTRVEDRDLLPAISLIFAPTEKINVRVTGSRTVARPEFRELAPFAFLNVLGGVAIRGNPEVVSTKIWNVDLRWEWFPSATEVIAISAFYKSFDDPIERVRRLNFISYTNADSANNIGAELEARKSLEFIHEKIRDLSVGVNFTYVFSRVSLGDFCDPEVETCSETDLLDVSTSRVRPLQDQAPFVVNAYLSYSNDRIGTSAQIIYNVEGRRISEVGASGLPDIYFEPQHLLHVVFGQRLYRRNDRELTLSASVQNIANQANRYTQGGEVQRLWNDGVSFSFGVDYGF